MGHPSTVFICCGATEGPGKQRGHDMPTLAANGFATVVCYRGARQRGF